MAFIVCGKRSLRKRILIKPYNIQITVIILIYQTIIQICTAPTKINHIYMTIMLIYVMMMIMFSFSMRSNQCD